MIRATRVDRDRSDPSDGEPLQPESTRSPAHCRRGRRNHRRLVADCLNEDGQGFGDGSGSGGGSGSGAGIGDGSGFGDGRPAGVCGFSFEVLCSPPPFEPLRVIPLVRLGPDLSSFALAREVGRSRGPGQFRVPVRWLIGTEMGASLMTATSRQSKCERSLRW